MIFPVVVPRGVSVPTVGGIKPPLPAGHPHASSPCPVCDRSLSQAPITLVVVGIEPHKRAQAEAWCTGAAIPVHAACAGLDCAEDAVDEDGVPQ